MLTVWYPIKGKEREDEEKLEVPGLLKRWLMETKCTSTVCMINSCHTSTSTFN